MTTSSREQIRAVARANDWTRRVDSVSQADTFLKHYDAILVYYNRIGSLHFALHDRTGPDGKSTRRINYAGEGRSKKRDLIIDWLRSDVPEPQDDAEKLPDNMQILNMLTTTKLAESVPPEHLPKNDSDVAGIISTISWICGERDRYKRQMEPLAALRDAVVTAATEYRRTVGNGS